MGSEGDVDFLQSFDSLGSQRVADLLESFVRTSWKLEIFYTVLKYDISLSHLTFSEVNMSEFVSCPVLTGEVLQETSHWKQRNYLPTRKISRTNTPEASEDPIR